MAGTVCGIFVNYDILDQLHTHLACKLLCSGVLFQTGDELLDIFLVLAGLLLSGFEISDNGVKLFLLGGVLLQQIDAHIFGNLAENLVLIDLWDKRCKLIKPAPAVCKTLLILGGLL